MGLELPFLHDADFTDMVKEDEFRSPLYLSDILHKAILEVNDKGIEETSVTMGIGKPSPGEHFVTDHPFFFVIKEGVWLSNLHGAYIGPFITIFTSGSVFLSAITACQHRGVHSWAIL